MRGLLSDAVPVRKAVAFLALGLAAVGVTSCASEPEVFGTYRSDGLSAEMSAHFPKGGGQFTRLDSISNCTGVAYCTVWYGVGENIQIEHFDYGAGRIGWSVTIAGSTILVSAGVKKKPYLVLKYPDDRTLPESHPVTLELGNLVLDGTYVVSRTSHEVTLMRGEAYHWEPTPSTKVHLNIRMPEESWVEARAEAIEILRAIDFEGISETLLDKENGTSP